MKKENIDVSSLAHTYIVFAPKYRRKVFYEDKKLEILRKLCEWNGVEIIEGEVCPVRVFFSRKRIVSYLFFDKRYSDGVIPVVFLKKRQK